MGNAITPETRALWLFLRNLGDWLTAAQIAHHWRPTFTVGEVDNHMRALLHGRFVAQRPAEGDALWAYAVTADCLPLPGHERAAPTTTTNLTEGANHAD
ncbi:hypothetical protein [Acidovorax sp. BLS4]|uniref:hypothetical protein n=1 Tax=Acidovorax sp. BLS4 TaxID=3273430 RepID=UPI0029433057|nr:hypothetical protein [Paracidovorax avenae]WOI45876.1 hypothetical protein R1Z03_01275 [Paracidovorax avenae]